MLDLLRRKELLWEIQLFSHNDKIINVDVFEMKMRLQKYILFLVCLAFLASCNSTQNEVSATQVFDDDTYASSSKLKVSWEPIEGATSYIIHYKESSDGSSSTEQEISASSQETSKTLDKLKSGTIYTFDVDACFDSACTSSQSLGTATASTEEEYWQLQGNGNSHDTATEIVDSGSVLAYAVISSQKDDEQIVLYYNPAFSKEVKGGVAVATLSSGESAAQGDTFEVQEEYGLEHPCLGKDTTSCGIDILTKIKASQAIPLASGL